MYYILVAIASLVTTSIVRYPHSIDLSLVHFQLNPHSVFSNSSIFSHMNFMKSWLEKKIYIKKMNTFTKQKKNLTCTIH